MVPSHHITCLCGAVRQTVQPKLSGDTGVTLSLCHCNSCRLSSGVLCTSYYPILKPDVTRGLRAFASDGSTRYFCAACGCHVFRAKVTDTGEEWQSATGVIEGTAGDGLKDARYTSHIGVADTKDGGASVWIPTFDGQRIETAAEPDTRLSLPPLPTTPRGESLGASCACGTVRFHITRPNAASYEPHSTYPDLMYSYKTTPETIGRNPDRDKWWVQADGTKYLAGTCACRSCRLFTGFEIQTWAFVPRANIFFHLTDGAIVPLDFATLPPAILQSYPSTSGVVREFCGGCGATVFWHDGLRPDVVDVSVGLLRAEEGARAEGWLRWWTARVSFEEETETGREGTTAGTARVLINALEEGLRSWEQARNPSA